MKKFTCAAVLAGLLLLLPSEALAWCRTTICDQANPPAGCGDTTASGCSVGTPIAWPSSCVSTSVNAQGSARLGITAADMRKVVQNAFSAWTNADCGNGQIPKFVVDLFPDVNCSQVTGDHIGFKSEGPNYNIWIFRDTDWPYGFADESAIAITTTQFSGTTGVIYDSDVELNSQSQDFTIGDTIINMDLPSVVQHEAGHFLGLAHSRAPNATMLPSINAGDNSRRNLTQDDIDAICDVYGHGEIDPNCDPEPRHGFSTECTFNKGCSTVAPGRGATQRLPASLIMGSLVAFLVVGRRRTLRPWNEPSCPRSNPG